MSPVALFQTKSSGDSSPFFSHLTFIPPSSGSSCHNKSLSPSVTLCVCHSTVAFEDSFIFSLYCLSTSLFLSPPTVNLLLVNKDHLSQFYRSHFLLDHYTISLEHSLIFILLMARGYSECFLSLSLHSLYSFKVLKYISLLLILTVCKIQFLVFWLPLISLFRCEAQSECRATISCSLLWPKQLWKDSRSGLTMWHGFCIYITVK